jgi:hypothetical protein
MRIVGAGLLAIASFATQQKPSRPNRQHAGSYRLFNGQRR